MADGYVQGAPDSTGKKVDASELTRVDTTVVERQRIVIADDSATGGLASVTALDGLRVTVNSSVIETLAAAIAMNAARSVTAAAVGGFYPVEYPPFLGA